MPAPSAEARRIRGEYFTPPPLVEAVLALAVPHLGAGPITVVDPACGDGAFLAAAARALPHARLRGLELDPAHAAAARRSARRARILAGDALRGGWDALLRTLPADAEELWLGNPPYNGTSPLLADAPAYRALRARLALDDALPRGTSLRDDYAFFLLLAAERLAGRPGVLAWVTSATLLDAFLYAPLRRRLLDRLALREVVDLGAGVFPGTRVRTCITVWRCRRGPAPSPRFRAWAPGNGPVEGAPVRPLAVGPPEWSLRPIPGEAARLDALWRATGEPLDVLVPVSCTGLKTRFDELLVDDDPDRLLARVDAFLRARDLARFAQDHGIPGRLLPKLRALHRGRELPSRVDPGLLRPFHRWAGARHRAGLPADARAFCYLDRRLIPRGDHRLVGDFALTPATASWCSTFASCRSWPPCSRPRAASPPTGTPASPLCSSPSASGPRGRGQDARANPWAPRCRTSPPPVSPGRPGWAVPTRPSGASRPSSTRPRSSRSGPRPSGAAGWSRFR